MIDPAASVEHLRARYLAAQIEGDRREAVRLVLEEGLALGLTAREITNDVVIRAQKEIGALWEQNRVSVATEHAATAISQLVLTHLHTRAEHEPSAGKIIVVACVEGEYHDLPARVVADVLDLAGFDVRYFGANVPLDALLERIRTIAPDLVCLSATMSFNVPALRRAVEAVRAASPARIAIGGHACAQSPTLATELGADLAPTDAFSLVDGARRLLGVRP